MLSRLFLRERFVARKLSWFDNPRPVPRRRKPRGLRRRVESRGREGRGRRRWRRRGRGEGRRVGTVESSRFQPSFSMAVAAQSFVQHTANKSNTLPANEHTDFASPSVPPPLSPVSPRYAPPPYSPSSLSTGGTTSVRGVRVRTARHTLGFAVVCEPPVPVVVSGPGWGRRPSPGNLGSSDCRREFVGASAGNALVPGAVSLGTAVDDQRVSFCCLFFRAIEFRPPTDGRSRRAGSLGEGN